MSQWSQGSVSFHSITKGHLLGTTGPQCAHHVVPCGPSVSQWPLACTSPCSVPVGPWLQERVAAGVAGGEAAGRVCTQCQGHLCGHSCLCPCHSCGVEHPLQVLRCAGDSPSCSWGMPWGRRPAGTHSPHDAAPVF